MRYTVSLLILVLTALGAVLMSRLAGQAPTLVASALPPAVQRTPPPPAAFPPSVSTRPPE